jgi:hypothetical protein
VQIPSLWSTRHAASGGSQDEIAIEVQALHRKLAPDLGLRQFPSLPEIEEAARQSGDIAAVCARFERRFGMLPSAKRLFDPPLVAV